MGPRWSGEPIPTQYLKGAPVPGRKGALVFPSQAVPHIATRLGCVGGELGPELYRVAVPLTRDHSSSK